jgi:hypothetical protein
LTRTIDIRQSNSRLTVTISHLVASSARWGLAFLSWKSASCFRRNRFCAAKPLTPPRIPAVLALEVQAGGKTRLPKDIRELIRRMTAENPTWGQERIANELKLKLGIRVSPRTVASYLRAGPGRKPDPKQRWMTFNFRKLYAFVIMELGTRRILHHNVTDHPTAE